MSPIVADVLLLLIFAANKGMRLHAIIDMDVGLTSILDQGQFFLAEQIRI